jgi:hypothetical protein
MEMAMEEYIPDFVTANGRTVDFGQIKKDLAWIADGSLHGYDSRHLVLALYDERGRPAKYENFEGVATRRGLLRRQRNERPDIQVEMFRAYLRYSANGRKLGSKKEEYDAFCKSIGKCLAKRQETKTSTGGIGVTGSITGHSEKGAGSVYVVSHGISTEQEVYIPAGMTLHFFARSGAYLSRTQSQGIVKNPGAYAVSHSEGGSKGKWIYRNLQVGRHWDHEVLPLISFADPASKFAWVGYDIQGAENSLVDGIFLCNSPDACGKTDRHECGGVLDKLSSYSDIYIVACDSSSPNSDKATGPIKDAKTGKVAKFEVALSEKARDISAFAERVRQACTTGAGIPDIDRAWEGLDYDDQVFYAARSVENCILCPGLLGAADVGRRLLCPLLWGGGR